MRHLTTIFFILFISINLFSQEGKNEYNLDTYKWVIKTPIIRDAMGQPSLSVEYLLPKNSSIEISGSYLFTGTAMYRKWRPEHRFLSDGPSQGYEFYGNYIFYSKDDSNYKLFGGFGVGYRYSYFNNANIESDYLDNSYPVSGSIYCNQSEKAKTILLKATGGVAIAPHRFHHFILSFYISLMPAISSVTATRDSFYIVKDSDNSTSNLNRAPQVFDDKVALFFFDTGIIIGFGFGNKTIIKSKQ